MFVQGDNKGQLNITINLIKRFLPVAMPTYEHVLNDYLIVFR